ncbi:MAG TPA: hypothetical protein DIS98_07955 [Colwellia sp.]|nr:hypothetical protein [Colwellia sp.]|tara:strand:+ start:4671 stop:5180 length:510 start_codon:yes stop_codon:yes gene_type:complete
MNNKLINLLGAVVVVFTSTVYADDGFRFGIGASGIISGSGDYETNTNIKFEAGYDFNQIVGLHASYEKLDGEYALKNFNGGAFKVGFDIGYKFQLAIFDLKPYAKIGANFIDVSSDELSNLIDDGATAYYGVGVRGSIGFVYIDLATDYVDTGFGDTDNTGSITIGMVF